MRRDDRLAFFFLTFSLNWNSACMFHSVVRTTSIVIYWQLWVTQSKLWEHYLQFDHFCTCLSCSEHENTACRRKLGQFSTLKDPWSVWFEPTTLSMVVPISCTYTVQLFGHLDEFDRSSYLWSRKCRTKLSTKIGLETYTFVHHLNRFVPLELRVNIEVVFKTL